MAGINYQPHDGGMDEGIAYEAGFSDGRKSLEEENRKLRECLIKIQNSQGAHDEYCKWLDADCTCGLDELLKGRK